MSASPQSLCYFAHHDPQGSVSDYVLTYLQALRRAGFFTVVASAGALSDAARRRLAGCSDQLIVRENAGFDFGSWAACLRVRPPEGQDFLLLCNDSVYGPTADLSKAIEILTGADADVYGFVASREGTAHLQSWFLLLRPAAYELAAFQEVLFAAEMATTKEEVIANGELRLSESFRSAGLRLHALYEPSLQGRISRWHPFNPSHVLWRELLVHVGVPFLKADILRTRHGSPGHAPHERVLGYLPAPLRAAAEADARRKIRPAHPRSAARRVMAMLLRRDFELHRTGRKIASLVNDAIFHLGLSVHRSFRRR